MTFRITLLRVLVFVTQKLGMKIRAQNDDEICRAFVIPWGGRIHLFGLPNHVQLVPVPLPEKNLTYARQSFCLMQATPPDFPRLGEKTPDPSRSEVCHVVICHLSAEETQSIYNRWTELNPESHILMAYGGAKQCFDGLPKSMNAVFIEDETLRTSDHPRERQQYTSIFRVASHWIGRNAPDTSHVHLVEYDVAPVIWNVGKKLVEALQAEGADMAGFGMIDLTGTIHPHNRYEISRDEFTGFLKSLSCRELPDRLITMLGCSSIWSRECFETVASLNPPRTYLEIAMPSLAHHLGFRVRPMPDNQEKFVTFSGDFSHQIERLKEEGAWMIHPCKRILDERAAPHHKPQS